MSVSKTCFWLQDGHVCLPRSTRRLLEPENTNYGRPANLTRNFAETTTITSETCPREEKIKEERGLLACNCSIRSRRDVDLAYRSKRITKTMAMAMVVVSMSRIIARELVWKLKKGGKFIKSSVSHE